MVKIEPLTILGNSDTPGGTYLLGITVKNETEVVFGRFHHGHPVPIPAGHYLYVGSAMRGLGSRLLRHATRTPPHPPHTIRPRLKRALHLAGLPAHSPRHKKLHWHIDYLLNTPQACLCHVIILHHPMPLEKQLAQWLLAKPETDILQPGLGASDHQGSTHLLRVPATATWQQDLVAQLAYQFN